MIFSLVCIWGNWATSSSVQDLLLDLNSGIIPGKIRRPNEVSRIELCSAHIQSKSLTSCILSSPLCGFFNSFNLFGEKLPLFLQFINVLFSLSVHFVASRKVGESGNVLLGNVKIKNKLKKFLDLMLLAMNLSSVSYSPTNTIGS